MFPVIEIILGLFVWMALPSLLLQKKKRKPYKRFVKFEDFDVSFLYKF